MSSLAREVVFGHTAGLKDVEDFTQALPSQAPGTTSPTFGRSSAPKLQTVGQVAGASWRGPAPVLDDERAHLLSHAFVPSDEEQPAELPQATSNAFSRKVRFGIRASWVVNWLLLFAKAAAFTLSLSYSVLASAVDSLVDLLSQAVLAVAEHQAATADPRYPVGRTRVAEMSVIWCAIIMFVSTVLVIRESVGALVQGFLHGAFPDLHVDIVMYIILGSASVSKLALHTYCRALAKNPIMTALAEDHLNDVMSNVGAVAGAVTASMWDKGWWMDPAVAVLFSLLIIRNWVNIVKEQGDKMVGLGAPDEVISAVQGTADGHHPDMCVDRITAYHHGAHFVVEVEVVLPASMTVRESHDVALSLQHKIEAIADVERAHVHVDYRSRSLEEHKVERNLKLGERDVMKPLDSAALSSSLSTSLSVVLMPGLGPGASLPATATVRLGTRAGLAPEHDAVGSHTHSADQGAGHTNGGARGARGGDVGVDDGGAGVNAA